MVFVMVSKINKNLSIEEFNEISKRLNLDLPTPEKAEGRFGFIISAKNKIGQIAKKIQGEYRAYITYGCSRNKVLETLSKRIKRNITLLKGKISGERGKVSNIRDKNTKFSRGLILYKNKNNRFKELENWNKACKIIKNISLSREIESFEMDIETHIKEVEKCIEDVYENESNPVEKKQLAQVFKEHLEKHEELAELIIAKNIDEALKRINNESTLHSFELLNQNNEYSTVNEEEIKTEQSDLPNIIESSERVEKSKIEFVSNEEFVTDTLIDQNVTIDPSIEEKIKQLAPSIISSGQQVDVHKTAEQEKPLSETNSAPTVHERIDIVVSSLIAPKKQDVQEPLIRNSGSEVDTFKIEERLSPIVNIRKEEKIDTSNILSKEIIQEFQKAIETDDKRKISSLLEEHTSLVNILNTPLGNGQLPLHYAIHKCSSYTISLLMKVGPPDLEIVDKHGFNAFDYAVQMSNTPLARQIMQINMKTEWESIKECCNEMEQQVKESKEKFDKEVRPYLSKPWLPDKNNPLNNPRLIENINNGAKFVEEVILSGGHIFTQDAKTKKTLLHLAVEKGSEEVVFYLLFQAYVSYQEYPLSEDAEGQTAEALAKANGNKAIQKLFEEFAQKDLSIETRRKMRDVMLKAQEFKNRYNQLSFQSHIVKQGYVGHNSLLIHAIQQSDYRAFIRGLMDGANVLTRDLKTGETLLDLAVKGGQQEIVFFLIKTLRIEGKEKALNLAKNLNNQEMADLISSMLDPPEFSPSKSLSLKKLKEFEEKQANYIKSYRLQQDQFSTAQKRQRADIAKHGVVDDIPHANGHNGIAVESIVKGDLNRLISLSEMGVDFNTIGVSDEKALKDPKIPDSPNQSESMLHSKTKSLLDGVDKVKEYIWGNKQGEGRSLLDVAVMYGKGDENSLKIIAFLLSKGVDPMLENDLGESPFSMALLKGNVKAATLMLNFKALSSKKENGPNLDEQTMERTLSLLMERSKLRDPLHVRSSTVTTAVVAGMCLLAGLLLSPGVMRYVYFLPLVLSNFMGSESVRQGFVQKNKRNPKQEPSTLSKLVQPVSKFTQSAIQPISRASILEMTLMPKTPILSMTSTVYNVASGVSTLVSTLNEVSGHAIERPFQTIYKVGMETLPVVQNILRFKDLYRTVFYPEEHRGIKVNVKDNKYNDTQVRVGDPELDERCPVDSKFILAKNEWDQKAFNKNPKEYVRQLRKDKVYDLSQDKKGSHELFTKWNTAQDTVLDEAKRPLSSVCKLTTKEVGTNILTTTVIKAGIIWGNTKKTMSKVPVYNPVLQVVSHPHFWTAVSIFSYAYRTISGK